MPITGNKNSILILGKLPPPFYGPAIATQIILNSKLNKEFNLIHLDTRLNTSMETMGKFKWTKILKTISIFFNFIKLLFKLDVKLVLIPIGQTTGALFKDSGFILLTKLFARKVVLHLRGSALLEWYKQKHSLFRIYTKWIISLSDGSIVLGNKLRYIFEPFLAPEKIFVVPNGADYHFPLKQTSNSKITLLYLGNILPGKGLEDVLESLSFLSDSEKKDLRLVVVGSFGDLNYGKTCKESVTKYSIPVTFCDSKSGSDKLQCYGDADIFIFPPHAPEGHPWVIVEAMAAGLPIISTDKGAITESVKNGVNGFIVEPRNSGQIAEKIRFLVENPGIRSQMGKESRRLYEENFTEEKMVEKLSQAFNSILES